MWWGVYHIQNDKLLTALRRFECIKNVTGLLFQMCWLLIETVDVKPRASNKKQKKNNKKLWFLKCIYFFFNEGKKMHVNDRLFTRCEDANRRHYNKIHPNFIFFGTRCNVFMFHRLILLCPQSSWVLVLILCCIQFECIWKFCARQLIFWQTGIQKEEANENAPLGKTKIWYIELIAYI